MSTVVHPTAVVDERAGIGTDVHIGPYAIVGPAVTIGDGCRIGPHAVLERNVTLGARCEIGSGAVLGSDPQDLKYGGERSSVQIGDGTRIREYATVNRGTGTGGCTVIGPGCYLMSYAHVGHDCVLGEGVTLANLVQLGGHVEIGAYASIAGSRKKCEVVTSKVSTSARTSSGAPATRATYASRSHTPIASIRSRTRRASTSRR